MYFVEERSGFIQYWYRRVVEAQEGNYWNHLNGTPTWYLSKQQVNLNELMSPFMGPVKFSYIEKLPDILPFYLLTRFNHLSPTPHHGLSVVRAPRIGRP